jgi:hypothetical protein
MPPRYWSSDVDRKLLEGIEWIVVVRIPVLFTVVAVFKSDAEGNIGDLIYETDGSLYGKELDEASEEE